MPLYEVRCEPCRWSAGFEHARRDVVSANCNRCGQPSPVWVYVPTLGGNAVDGPVNLEVPK